MTSSKLASSILRRKLSLVIPAQFTFTQGTWEKCFWTSVNSWLTSTEEATLAEKHWWSPTRERCIRDRSLMMGRGGL